MKGKKSLWGEFCTYYCQNFVVFLHKLCDFEIDLIKWLFKFVSCNFAITRMISDQIALHSVQLPL